MKNFRQSFQCTPSNLSDFIEFISVTIFAAELIKLKLLINILTVLCRILK